MSVLSLYMFRQIAVTFLILIGVLTGLVWVSQAIRLLNLVIEKGRSIGEFLALTGFLVPWIAGLVAPTALFIATVYVLYRINADSELVVMHAAGGSKWRLLRPFAACAIIVTGFVLFVNLYAMPHGMRAFRDKLIEVRTDLIATLVQEGQFVSPEAGLTVHIRSRADNGDLLGLIFHDTRQPGARYTYLAERARLLSEGNSSSILMFNGTLQRRRAGPSEVDVVKFEQYTLDLGSFGPNRDVPYYEAPEKFMSELLNPDPKDPIFLSTPGKLFAEAHDRMSSPLYAFAMMLVGFAGLSGAQSNRIGRLWLILGIALLAIGVRVAGATVINLMVKDNALVPLAYLIPSAAITLSVGWLIFEARGRGKFSEILANQAGRRPARRLATKIGQPRDPRGVDGNPAEFDGRTSASNRPISRQAPRQTDHVPEAIKRPAGAPNAPAPGYKPDTAPGPRSDIGQQNRPDPNIALRRLAGSVQAGGTPETPDNLQPSERPGKPPVPSMSFSEQSRPRDGSPGSFRNPADGRKMP